jgi:hypothetical protein
VVFLKLQLVMFFEGLRSERQLIATASLNLAHRWYLGYALDEVLPDHSSLTRIRQRLGVDVFERFFEKVVDLCQDAGLVWGRELYFDGTKVEANADFDSLVPRFYHEAKTHLGDLFTDGASPEDDPPATLDLPAGIVRLPTEPDVNGPWTSGERPWRLLEERRLDPHRPSDRDYDRMSEWRVSTTDPDATPMRTGARTTLGYHDHYVVDGGKRRIILAAFVTPADVTDNMPMRDLLWRVCFRRKLRPHHVTGDAKYGTTENVVAIEDAGIRAYVPLPDLSTGQTSTVVMYSPTSRTGMSISVPRANHCRGTGPSTRRRSSSTVPTRPPATPVRAKPNAPTGPTAAPSSARSTRRIWRWCGTTTPPRRTRRPCASGRSGSNRSLPRPRCGTAYAGSGGGA